MPFAAPGGEETCQLRVSTTPILEASESSGHVVGVCEYVGLRAEKLPRFAHHVCVIFTYITFFPPIGRRFSSSFVARNAGAVRARYRNTFLHNLNRWTKGRMENVNNTISFYPLI